MDREKVIKESEEAIDILAKAEEPTFWMDFVRCAFENAIALLKEQEPQSVIVHEKPRNGNILWFADCPKCNHGIERDKHKRFCGFCGQAVKWE